jgi:spore germination protein YaaH
MDWGKHWSTSAPGAIADLPWARSVADYVASMPNKRRFVLGFGLYGMDWPAGGGTAHPATPLEFDDVMNLADAVGATAVIDPVAAAPHFSYTDAQGVGHDVWYTDAPTVAAQIRLARDRGLGIGFWRLGREDQRIWDDSLLAPGVRWPAP